MIFLILIAFIAFLFIGLNMYDNSNIDKIKQYLEAQNCQELVYSYGKYKGICSDKIIVIRNTFSLDIENNKEEILYVNVQNTQSQKMIISVQTESKTFELHFKESKNLEKYYKKLQDIK